MLALSQLTAVEITALTEAETTIERGLNTFVDVGNALAEIRDGKLYRQTHGTFEEYCRGKWGFSSEYARLQMRTAEVVRTLSETPTIVGVLPAIESQARPLTRLEPVQQVAAWQSAVETAPNGKITAAHVERVVQGFRQPPPHVFHNSGDNEWYTPVEYIDAAYVVMGGIDLDPASSAQANKTVKATRYYTAQDDGLTQEWAGRVWMNPPYAQPLIGSFSTRLRLAVESGKVTEAITLTNNATETAWFSDLLANAGAVCFPRSRIKFIDRNGNPGGTPLQGQAIIYTGPNVAGFIEQFRRFGSVLICLTEA